MRIILIGGGEIGLALSRALAQDHAIVVVDQDASVAERFAALDVQFETGGGTDPEVLRQAASRNANFSLPRPGSTRSTSLPAPSLTSWPRRRRSAWFRARIF